MTWKASIIPWLFCADTRGQLCGTTRIFGTGAANLPHGWTQILCRRTRIFRGGEHRFSMQIWVENGGNQKANFMRNMKDGETRRNDRMNYHCKNRTYLDMKYNSLQKDKKSK